MLSNPTMRMGGVLFSICMGWLAQPAAASASVVCEHLIYNESIRLPSAVQQLTDLNDGLERGKWTLEGLISAGVLVPSNDPVLNIKDGVPNPMDPTPFRRVMLPFARTGFYLPEGVKFEPGHSLAPYQGIFLVMPGIGTNVSNATTLFNLGMTLMGGKNPALALGEGQPKMRLLPVMLDATMGGLGATAPAVFGQPEVAVQVVRHVRLILKLLFPDAPFIVGGRSQGGLIAMEYTRSYSDVEGVVVVNPSPSDEALHRLSIRTSEAAISAGQATEAPLVLNRTWKIYEAVAPLFRSFRTEPERALKKKEIPLLLLAGINDPAYGGKPYLDHCALYCSQSPSREVEYFDAPVLLSHDLWARRDRRLFASVLRRMTRFIQPKLSVAQPAP